MGSCSRQQIIYCVAVDELDDRGIQVRRQEGFAAWITLEISTVHETMR